MLINATHAPPHQLLPVLAAVAELPCTPIVWFSQPLLQVLLASGYSVGWPATAPDLLCSCLRVRVQTMRGTWAKTPPTGEIRAVIKEAWREISTHPDWPKGVEPVWSLDNVSVHNSALKGWDDPNGWRIRAGIQGTVMQPPSYSPDLHHVVEHAIANMTTGFKDMLFYGAMDPTAQVALHAGQVRMPTMDEFFDMQCEAFFTSNTVQSIRDDVLGLPDTYKAVIDVNGGWTNKIFA